MPNFEAGSTVILEPRDKDKAPDLAPAVQVSSDNIYPPETDLRPTDSPSHTTTSPNSIGEPLTSAIELGEVMNEGSSRQEIENELTKGIDSLSEDTVPPPQTPDEPPKKFSEEHANTIISYGEYTGPLSEALKKCNYLEQLLAKVGETAFKNIIKPFIPTEAQINAPKASTNIKSPPTKQIVKTDKSNKDTKPNSGEKPQSEISRPEATILAKTEPNTEHKTELPKINRSRDKSERPSHPVGKTGRAKNVLSDDEVSKDKSKAEKQFAAFQRKPMVVTEQIWAKDDGVLNKSNKTQTELLTDIGPAPDALLTLIEPLRAREPVPEMPDTPIETNLSILNKVLEEPKQTAIHNDKEKLALEILAPIENVAVQIIEAYENSYKKVASEFPIAETELISTDNIHEDVNPSELIYAETASIVESSTITESLPVESGLDAPEMVDNFIPTQPLAEELENGSSLLEINTLKDFNFDDLAELAIAEMPEEFSAEATTLQFDMEETGEYNGPEIITETVNEYVNLVEGIIDLRGQGSNSVNLLPTELIPINVSSARPSRRHRPSLSPPTERPREVQMHVGQARELPELNVFAVYIAIQTAWQQPPELAEVQEQADLRPIEETLSQIALLIDDPETTDETLVDIQRTVREIVEIAELLQPIHNRFVPSDPPLVGPTNSYQSIPYPGDTALSPEPLLDLSNVRSDDQKNILDELSLQNRDDDLPELIRVMHEKIIELLKLTGYTNPEQALDGLISTRGSEFLIQAVEYLAYLSDLNFRPELLRSTPRNTASNFQPVTDHIGKTALATLTTNHLIAA